MRAGRRYLRPICCSGSTIEAALLEGLRAVGIEQEHHNVAIIRKRLAGVQLRLKDVPQAEQIGLL